MTFIILVMGLGSIDPTAYIAFLVSVRTITPPRLPDMVTTINVCRSMWLFSQTGVQTFRFIPFGILWTVGLQSLP